MSAPGPVALGRAVIVGPGGAAPAAWASADRVVIDDAGAGRARRGRAPAPRGVEHAHAGRDRAGGRPGRFRTAEAFDAPPWQLTAGFEAWTDRLHFLVWANSYDARADGEPIWWWARKAARLGARRGRRRPTSCCPTARRRGSTVGPARRSRCRSTAPVSSTASPSSSAGSRRSRRRSAPTAELAPGPAGGRRPRRRARRGSSPRPGRARPGCSPSGYRHLLADRGYEREAVVALAYNKKAQEEMASRLPGLGARIQTLNAWGYGILSRALGRRPELLDEREVRAIVERLVPTQAAAREHRSDRAVPRRPLAHPPRPARPAGGGGQPRRRPRPGRRLRAVPRRAAPPGRHRLRRAGLRRARGAAARRRAAPRRAGRPPPPPRRRAPGPHPRPRAPHPPGRRARRPTCSGSATTTRCIYGHVGADPRFLIDYAALLPRRRRARPRGELPLPGPGHRGGRPRCSPTTTCGWRRRSGPAPTSSPTTARSPCRRTRPTRARGRSSTPSQGWLARAGRRRRARSPCSRGCSRCCSRPTWRWRRRACRSTRSSTRACCRASGCGRRSPTCASRSTPST